MRPIQLTEEAKATALKIFKEMLLDYKGDKSLSISITPDTLLNQKEIHEPTVFVTANAFLKMTSLINTSTEELAWHGTVVPIDTDGKRDYLIKDIFVYPQEVTGTTVDAVEDEYAKWLMELDDETINTLRFQGHSHVKMSTSPSGRDTDNWQKFLNILRPGEFYLFCIGNQKGDFYWNIYDTATNILFENADINMVVIDNLGNDLAIWAEESIKNYIKKPEPIQTSYYHSTLKDTNASDIHCVTKKLTYEGEISSTLLEYYESFIPPEIRSDVQYNPDLDIYYADHWTPGSGLIYNRLYTCWTCEGNQYRKTHVSTLSVNKNKKTDKKKENRKQAKGGKNK